MKIYHTDNMNEVINDYGFVAYILVMIILSNCNIIGEFVIIKHATSLLVCVKTEADNVRICEEIENQVVHPSLN